MARKPFQRSTKLEKIFFLRHGRANTARKLGATDVMTRFLKCSFPPFWEAEGMGFTMDFFSDVIVALPASELSFVPDKNVIEMINGSH
jgi:hypothetical protein